MCLYNKGEDVRIRKQCNCMVGARQLQNYNRLAEESMVAPVELIAWL